MFTPRIGRTEPSRDPKSFASGSQENVSRIEQRSDLLLSTLSGYVEAMGGKLSLVAEFPDRPPVALTGIAALDQDAPSKKPAGRDSR